MAVTRPLVCQTTPYSHVRVISPLSHHRQSPAAPFTKITTYLLWRRGGAGRRGKKRRGGSGGDLDWDNGQEGVGEGREADATRDWLGGACRIGTKQVIKMRGASKGGYWWTFPWQFSHSKEGVPSVVQSVFQRIPLLLHIKATWNAEIYCRVQRMKLFVGHCLKGVTEADMMKCKMKRTLFDSTWKELDPKWNWYKII